MLAKLKSVPAKRLTSAAFRNAQPSHLGLWSRDLSGVERKPGSSKAHLEATMNWLRNAHEACGNRGVSGGYSVIDGWLDAYPETTGYIIPTFFDFADISLDDEWRKRAIRMADWETEVQMENGAVQAGLYKKGKEQIPAVFNTGQVILGWCRAFTETKDECYLAAAQKAGDWLISVQSESGAWVFESQETETDVHTYDVRTAWSLLEIFRITEEAKYRDAAVRQIDWTLDQQRRNGWFENNAFFTSEDKWTAPFTHTIAYVMEGLQESYRILGDERYLNAYSKTAEKLLRIFELRRFMAGDFNERWKASTDYSCLTGNAQIATVWLKLYRTNGDMRFLNGALKLNDYTKSKQNLSSLNKGIRGGVQGSHPIRGRYTPFIFPNWAAKFHADSLMLEENVMVEFEREILG